MLYKLPFLEHAEDSILSNYLVKSEKYFSVSTNLM